MTGYLQAYEDQHLKNGRGLRAMFLDHLDRRAQRIGQYNRHSMFLPRVLRNAGLSRQRPLRVLDIGIGNGYTLSYRDPQITKFGVDLSDHFQAELTRHNIELLIANVGKENIPMPDGSFDLIMLNHLIEHIQNYDFLITEIKRLLAPGGVCLIRTPDFAKKRANFYDDYTHVKPYTHGGLRHMAAAYGFEIIKTLQSDHARIQLDILTDGKFESVIFNNILPGGNEIETYWRKPAPHAAEKFYHMPAAFNSPPPHLQAAWDKFIQNDNNCGHAERGYTGGSLQSHLQAVWQSANNSARRIAAQTSGFQPKDILDLGASVGGLSLGLCAHYPDATVYALEPEDEAFQTLAAMQQSAEMQQLKIFHGAGEALPLPDNSIDLIVCHTVLEHVRDPEKVLQEMYRVLRPGGMVHLELPNYIWPVEPHLHTVFIPFAGKGVMKFLGRLQGLKDSEVKFMDHLQLVTKPQLEAMLRRTGFRFHNLVADKIFAQENKSGHHIHSGWKRKLLQLLRGNPLGKLILYVMLLLGIYPSLLYRLEKPAN